MRYGCVAMSLLCAWVLWGDLFDGFGPFVMDAFDKQEQCALRSDANYASAKRDGRRTDYMCLPDTVDPRAPKAGK